MTREEAIKILNTVLLLGKCDCPKEEIEECLKMAIKSLEQEPCCNCIEFKRYLKEMGFEIEQEPILDKIRAEIEQIIGERNLDDYDFCSGLICARNIIDKYKAESEG